MTNNITIKSGIDINSEEFKKYYEILKQKKINCYYLDLAVSNNSPVLNNPLVFEESEYTEYKVDDISFIISGGEIIGHQVYSLEKSKSVISLGMNIGNHLDMDRVKNMSGRISFGLKEIYCKYNIDINELVINYLSDRIHNKLEYIGTISNESKIHIKK